MFEKLRIILFGTQPFAKVDNKSLERIILREFGSQANEAKEKLLRVKYNTPNSKYRISSAIIKLADRDINALDSLIEISNNDYRDVLARAEYPRCFNLGLDAIKRSKIKQIYLADWKDYSNWVNKK